MSISLSSQIQAILFFKNEPITVKKIAEMTSVTAVKVEEALKELEEKLSESGIVLVRNDDEIMLGTSPEASPLIEKLTKEELSRDLGKAGLETLAIILYKTPVLKREIDYIRGVNSGFILRSLMVRGLISREESGGRGYSYQPTLELLSFLGISKLTELPDHQEILKELENFSTKEETENQENKGENTDARE